MSRLRLLLCAAFVALLLAPATAGATVRVSIERPKLHVTADGRLQLIVDVHQGFHGDPMAGHLIVSLRDPYDGRRPVAWGSGYHSGTGRSLRFTLDLETADPAGLLQRLGPGRSLNVHLAYRGTSMSGGPDHGVVTGEETDRSLYGNSITRADPGGDTR
jgi:hypothetical protein